MFISIAYLLLRLSLQLLPRSNPVSRDVEIVVLRHQLRVLRRQVSRPDLRNRDRVFLAAASRLLPRKSWSSFCVTPQTLLRWHRELIKLQPAPRRDGPNWSEFLRAQAHGIIACDFFTVETVWLKTLYVLFFIELSTRKVHVAGVTAHPDSAWVTQQARNVCMSRSNSPPPRFLIHDRDSKFTGPFDDVFEAGGTTIIQTPYRAPRANAFAERWVLTARTECVDWILIRSRRHLERVLRDYIEHYGRARPHRGLDLKTPESLGDPPERHGAVRLKRRDVLGGLIHEYDLAA
jgi:putative transposase